MYKKCVKTDEKANNLVLVYGSLMRGGRLHNYLDDETTEFVGEGHFIGGLYDVGENFPALSYGQSFYIGEVYKVNDLTLKTLDMVEQYNEEIDDGMYLRRKIKVVVNGKNEECYTYIWSYKIRNTDKLLPTGTKWNEHIMKYLRIKNA